MECPSKKGQAAEFIVAYVARTLDAGTAADFQRHLAACAACRELTTRQQAVWSALDEWQPAPVSPGFDEQLLRRVEQQQPALRRWWTGLLSPQWSWRPVLPLAAACAVLVIAFLLKDSDRPAPAPAAGQPNARIEQQVEHALDDMDMLRQLGVESASPRS